MRGMWIVWTMEAVASDCSQPFREAEVQALVTAATAAVESDDVSGFRDKTRQLARMVPCLDAPISTRPLARLYVLEAIVRLAEGGGPEQPLGTALRIWPGVEIPPFLADRARKEELGPSDPLPYGVRAWIDGQPVGGFPPLVGDHVLQREEGGRLESVVGNAPPRAWVSKRSGGGGSSDGVGLLAGGLGLERAAQRPEQPGDFVPDAEVLSPSLSVMGEGALELGPAFGVWGRLWMPLRVGRLSGGGLRIGPGAAAGVYGPIGPVRIELGAVATSTPTLQGDRNVPELDVLPVVGARWWGDPVDVGVSVAAWTDSVRVRATGGWTVPVDVGDGALRAGVELAVRSRGFEQQVPGGARGVRAASVEGLGSIGVVWR